MNALKNIVPFAWAGVLAACASSSPPPVLLTLPPAVAAASAQTGKDATPGLQAPSLSASAPVLAVRRISIPEYLTVRRVRFRADAATLGEWPNTYWAERIEIGVSREFASALHRQLPEWSICETNCGEPLPALSVLVDLVPMDYLRSTQKLQAHARITVTSGDAKAAVLASQETSVEIAAPADTPQGQAQAMSTLVQQVATEAAAMVRAVKP